MVSRLRARGTFVFSDKSTQKRRLVDTDCVSLAAAHAPRLAHSVVSPLPTTNASLVCRGSPFCGFKTSFRDMPFRSRDHVPRDCGQVPVSRYKADPFCFSDRCRFAALCSVVDKHPPIAEERSRLRVIHPGKVESRGGNRRSGVLLWPFQGRDS